MVKEGYKETILGVFPENWAIKQLRDVCNKVTDGTHGTPKEKSEGYPFVTAKNITNGKLDFTEISYISEKDHRKIISRSKPEKGDILFTHIGTIGQVVEVDVDFEFSIKNVALFKPNNDIMSNRYFKYSLESKVVQNFIKRILQGGVQQYLGLGTLRGFNIPVPPLSEQKRIASILSSVDKSIKKTDEVIEETKELKKGLMQELLTKGIGHSEFKESKFGKIPLGWEIKQLGEVTHNHDKNRIPLSSKERKERKGKFPYYGAQGIIDYIDDFIFKGEYLLVAEDGENLKSRKKPLATVVKGEFWANNHTHILSLSLIHI